MCCWSRLPQQGLSDGPPPRQKPAHRRAPHLPIDDDETDNDDGSIRRLTLAFWMTPVSRFVVNESDDNGTAITLGS